jgi:hypothetical protein
MRAVSVGLILPPLVRGGGSGRYQAHSRLVPGQFLKGVDQESNDSLSMSFDGALDDLAFAAPCTTSGT